MRPPCPVCGDPVPPPKGKKPRKYCQNACTNWAAQQRWLAMSPGANRAAQRRYRAKKKRLARDPMSPVLVQDLVLSLKESGCVSRSSPTAWVGVPPVQGSSA